MPDGRVVEGRVPEELSLPVGIAVGRMLVRSPDGMAVRFAIALAIGAIFEEEMGVTVTTTSVVATVVMSLVT